MQVRNVSLADFERIVVQVSADKYAGNLKVHQDSRSTGAQGQSCRARVACHSSSGEGARRSWSGRRMPVACWHSYRDVLRAVFAEFPNAVVVTSMARYNGVDGFEASYPATAYTNVGSQMSPVTMPELCSC